MKKYEYNHIRMSYTFLSFFSKAAFDRQLCELHKRMGDEGWELKSSICEGFLPSHIHFVFGREEELPA
ncbi:MAG: hypothetical protein GX594_10810 [Pirellulaceae bacterium]|nr:hypothetical protein [Pirellulaceae bacterium]